MPNHEVASQNIVAQINLRTFCTRNAGEMVDAIRYTELSGTNFTTVGDDGVERPAVHVEQRVLYSNQK